MSITESTVFILCALAAFGALFEIVIIRAREV